MKQNSYFNIGNMVFLVDQNGSLILDSCPLKQGILTTCPGTIQDQFRIFALSQHGGIYTKIANHVNAKYKGFSKAVSGDTFTIDGYWVSLQQITDRNLDWVAVITIRIDAYMNKVLNHNQ